MLLTFLKSTIKQKRRSWDELSKSLLAVTVLICHNIFFM